MNNSKNNLQTSQTSKSIKKWDFKDLPKYPVIFIVAKRGEGKTVMIKDIIYNTRERYDDVYLFSRTANINLEDPFPFIKNNEHRYDDYDDKILRDLYNEQKRKLMMYKKKEIDRVDHILLIFDDVIMNKEIKKKNSMLEELCVNGRHVFMTVVITAQVFSSGMLPSIRKNADIFISFNIMDSGTRELVTEYYLSLLGKKLGQQLLIDVVSEKAYQALISKTYIKGIKKYEDFVFKYTAKLEIPDFTIPQEKPKNINADLDNGFYDVKLIDDDDFFM